MVFMPAEDRVYVPSSSLFTPQLLHRKTFSPEGALRMMRRSSLNVCSKLFRVTARPVTVSALQLKVMVSG